MSVYEVVGCVAALGLAIPGVLSIPAHWRAEHTFWQEETPIWWVWGDWSWRGWIRAGPTMVAGAALLSVCLPFMMAFPPRSTGQAVAAGIGLGGLGVALLLSATITLFARPRALIPPHLRGRQPRRQEVGAP
jgi:hypothetical protein